MDDRAAGKALGLAALPARRLVERQVDLHLRAPVAEPRRRLGDGCRHVRAAEERPVELRWGDIGDDGPGRGNELAVREPHPGRPAVGDENLAHVRREPHLATRVGDDPGQRVDEAHSAADRYRHAAELQRGADHLRHEPGGRLLGTEACVQDPGSQNAVRGLGLERRRDPVAAADEGVARELEQATTAESTEGLAAECEPGCRPELGGEDPEGEIGVAHELVELTLPRNTVARREPAELRHVALEGAGDECRRAVREGGSGGQVGIDIHDAARRQLTLELAVGSGTGEERVPGREHLVGESGQGQSGRGTDAAAGDVVALEHTHAPAFSRQERCSDKRVDPRADEHRVEGRHRAMLQNRFRLDMSPPGVRPIEACFYERSSTRVRQPSRRQSPSSPSTMGHVPSQAARRSST